MTSKSDSIGVTCTRLRHFADTFSQWNSCWKKITLRHMTENKCGYQMHIFVTSFSAQHASAWRCFCMVQPLRQPFRPKCTNRILQMHHQNPVVPSESDVHPQNPVCTYSVNMAIAVLSTICSSELSGNWIHFVGLWGHYDNQGAQVIKRGIYVSLKFKTKRRYEALDNLGIFLQPLYVLL